MHKAPQHTQFHTLKEWLVTDRKTRIYIHLRSNLGLHSIDLTCIKGQR